MVERVTTRDVGTQGGQGSEAVKQCGKDRERMRQALV